MKLTTSSSSNRTASIRKYQDLKPIPLSNLAFWRTIERGASQNHRIKARTQLHLLRTSLTEHIQRSGNPERNKMNGKLSSVSKTTWNNPDPHDVVNRCQIGSILTSPNTSSSKEISPSWSGRRRDVLFYNPSQLSSHIARKIGVPTMAELKGG